MNPSPVDPIKECARLSLELKRYKQMRPRTALELSEANDKLNDELAEVKRDRDGWKKADVLARIRISELECERDEARRELSHNDVLAERAQLRADLAAAKVTADFWLAHEKRVNSEFEQDYLAIWRAVKQPDMTVLESVLKLKSDLAAAREDAERWKQQYQTVCDERAASFLRIGRALGGMSLTEYQPEIDLEIEAAAKAAWEDTARLDWLDAEHHTKNGLPIAALVVKVGYKRDSSEWANVCGDIRAAIDSARAGGAGK